MAKPAPSPAAFVTGIAWIMIIVAAWATLRLAYMLVTSFEADAVSQLFGIVLPKLVLQVLIIMHLLSAMFSIYGGISMLRLRAWTRIYFATVLLSIGLEACVAAGWLGFGGDGNASAAGLEGVQLASGGALLLLGLTAILLAWKLWRDRGIQSVLK